MMVNEVKVNFLIVGYRGYGLSEGTPSEKGIKLDGEAILDHVFSKLKDEIDTNNVYIMGRSLGGAVAIHSITSNNQKYPVNIKSNILDKRLNTRKYLSFHR